MRLPDVNVLIFAHREDAPDHGRYAEWITDLTRGQEPFALSELVLSSVLRIVTNQKLFDPPTPMNVALDFCQQLLSCPNAVVVRPASQHWQIFVELIQEADIKGPMVTDAYLAALAIEHECEFITTDRDFARFSGLSWKHPLNTG